MPVLYKPTEHAFYTEGPPLTEQEHRNSCDINKMIKSAHRGLPVRGGYTPQYGYDDTTMDGVTFRVEKQRLEESLKEAADTEFTKAEFDLIPQSIREKFNFRVKKETAPTPDASKNELNDDSGKKGKGSVPSGTPKESAHDGPIKSQNGA